MNEKQVLEINVCWRHQQSNHSHLSVSFTEQTLQNKPYRLNSAGGELTWR